MALFYGSQVKKLSEIEALTEAVYPPRPFEDPYTGKARMLVLRVDEAQGVAYQIDLANHEYRVQHMGPGAATFGPWLPLASETLAQRAG